MLITSDETQITTISDGLFMLLIVYFLTRSSNCTTNATTNGNGLSNATSNFQPRSSFNSHQKKLSTVALTTPSLTTTTTTPSSVQSTVEYASFNIKPSQYKQTGIFLPINNSSPKGLVHLVKEDLELIIQTLRNIQKQRSNASLEQFTKSLDDFVDKFQPQLLAPGDADCQAKLRSLSGAVKAASASVKEAAAVVAVSSSSSNVESASLEGAFAHLSRLLNEFIQNLDKLNSFYIQQSLVLK